MCPRPLRPISIKLILVIDLRWSQIKFDLLVFLQYSEILKQILYSGSVNSPGNTVTNQRKFKRYHYPSWCNAPRTDKAVNHDTETRNPNPEPNVAPDVAPIPKASIPFPSRRNDEKRKEKANDQNEKFYEIFRDLSFEISFTDALMLMPKFASTLKTLIGNKEKLSELARTPLNENCSAVILNLHDARACRSFNH
ncbi:hypothetical protein Tco_0853147 [Tanacetum coccineum]